MFTNMTSLAVKHSDNTIPKHVNTKHIGTKAEVHPTNLSDTITLYTLFCVTHDKSAGLLSRSVRGIGNHVGRNNKRREKASTHTVPYLGHLSV
jgi:hypothetical protein